MASGSEVSIALEVAKILESKGVQANVVSVPCYDLLVEQSREYLEMIINPNTKVVAIEAARGLEWYRFADVVIGMDTFGASAPAELLYERFGFSPATIAESLF